MLTPFVNQLDPSWKLALTDHLDKLEAIESFIESENEVGRTCLPPHDQVLRAFSQPINSVKVVIVGQDPYPTRGDAHGLAFSVEPSVRIPRSLSNIFQELSTDLGCPTPATGDLRPWATQGVLLLNRVLTVQAGASGSHHGHGWEEFTEAAISALLAHAVLPPVFILWGKPAQKLLPIVEQAPVVWSTHPSPLSARKGFFGSRPFSRTNAILVSRGQESIDWCLP